jgi:hypothetical protein
MKMLPDNVAPSRQRNNVTLPAGRHFIVAAHTTLEGGNTIGAARSRQSAWVNTARVLAFPSEVGSKGVQVGQQILHFGRRHDLAEGRHHVATGEDHLAHALVVGGHSAL